MKYKKNEMSPEWDRIKDYVGGAKKQSKHPLQIEADRLGMKKPLNMDEGGDPADEALRQSLGLGGFNPTSNTSAFGGRPPQVANIPPMPPPNVSQGTIQAGAPVTSPVQASPAPIPTDYNQQASQIMGGVTPDSIQRLMQSLQQNANRGQVGAGIAGLGDAISSVGGIKGEHMNNAENLIQKNREMGMQLPGQMAAVGKEQYGLSQELQAKDPASPYSKLIQNSERPILLKLGWTDEQISKTPAIAINDATKNGLGYEEIQTKYGLEREIHNQTFQMQKDQLDNIRQNQAMEHDIQRQGQELQHPVLSGIKKFMNSGDGGSSAPKAGMVEDGYIFLGGNPADKNSWKKQ